MPNKNKWIRSVIIILIISASIIAIFLYRRNNNEEQIDYTEAQIKDLVQMVSVTGHVQPVDRVDLLFEVTGKIDMVLVNEGDEVMKDDALVKLVNSDLSAQYSKAQAVLASEYATLKQLEAALQLEEANLDELNRGTREEDIDVYQTKLNNAEQAQYDAEIELQNTIAFAELALDNLYEDALDAVNDAYAAVDDVLNNKTDDLFSQSINDRGDLVFVVSEQQDNTDARNGRAASYNILDKLRGVLDNPPIDHDELDIALSQTKVDLFTVQSFLFDLSSAIANSVGLASGVKTTYKANVDLARDSITSVRGTVSDKIQLIQAQKTTNQTNIDLYQNKLNTFVNSVTLAQEQLTQIMADALPETIASQQARIAGAQANIEAQKARIQAAELELNIISSQIEKTVLRAPFDGIIIEMNAKEGEISSLTASVADPVVSLISMNKFDVKAKVPEVDIANIKIGDSAEITLDAYGPDVVLESSVSAIELTEKIIEGVPTYQVTMIFNNDDDRIKSGMTANIDIMTGGAKGVVAVPQRTVVRKNGDKYLKILQDGQVIERKVQTGISSWDGQVEIISGLSEGEKVVTFIEE